MNKINTILLVLLFMAVQAVAGPVSKEEALLKAKAFMADKGMEVVSVNLARKAPSKVSGSNADASSAAYYIFNASAGAAKGSDATGGGFVIISGDDRTMPVLGYSDSGLFNEENIPDNLKAWLEDYADQIAAIEAGAQPAKVPSVGAAISPLIEAKWGQDNPYNLLTPTYDNGSGTLVNCATGCGATAVAQVMYYHKYPSETSVVIPAYKSEAYSNLTFELAELPTTTFDWGKMQPTYNSSSTDDQKNEVAKLMQYVGHALKMEYGPSSGCQSNIPASVLVEYFGYDQNAKYVSRFNYTIEEWNQLVYDELKASRPVCYSAQSSGGGHAFVIDGYNGDGLFHVNWGWDGMCDGYFALEVLNPNGGGTGASSTSGGYSFLQGCAIGVQKPTGNVFTPKYLEGYMLQYSADVLSCRVINNNHSVTDFEFAFAVVDDDNTVSSVLGGTAFSVNLDFSSYTTLTITLSDYTWTANSTTKIIPVSRQKGQTNWKPCMTSDDYVIVTADASSNLTVEVYPKLNLEVISIVWPETIYSNTPCNIAFTVKNNGTADYRGKLQLSAQNTENSEITLSETEGLYVEPETTVTVNMTVKFPTVGAYSVLFGVGEDESNLYSSLKTENVTVQQGTFIGKFIERYVGNNVCFTFTLINGSDDSVSGNLVFNFYTRSTDDASWTQLSGYYSTTFTANSGAIGTKELIVNETIIEGNEYKCVAMYTPIDGTASVLAESDIVAVPITVSVTDAGGYATYCNAYRSLDFSAATNIKAYKVTVSGSKAILTEVEKVNKGQGVVLRSSGVATEAIPLLTDGTTESTMNLLVGLTTGTTIYETATADGNTYTNYVLAKKNGNIAFYKANTTGTTLAAGKAYLRVLSTNSASYFSLDSEDDGTTGINEAVNAPANDNAFYTLQGIRVDTPTKGLYIHRGRVVLVK